MAFFMGSAQIIKRHYDEYCNIPETKAESLLEIVLELGRVFNADQGDEMDEVFEYRRRAEVNLAGALMMLLDFAARYGYDLDLGWPKQAPDQGTFNARGELLADAPTTAVVHGEPAVGVMWIITDLVNVFDSLECKPGRDPNVVQAYLGHALFEIVRFAGYRGYDLDGTVSDILGDDALTVAGHEQDVS